MSESLEMKVERLIRTGEGPPSASFARGEDFDALALEVFANQFEKNRPYQAFCLAQEKTPATVKQWSEIPAVPIAAFKSAELVTFPINHAAAEFHSSGTTQKTPSRHYLKTLTPYEASLSAGFAQWVLPDQAVLPFLILAPSPGEAPRSSLTWMLDVAKRRWGAAGSDYFIQRGRVDDWRLFRALAEHQAVGRPVALLGTTLAFLTLFDQCARQKKTFACATDSRIMDTGGMKTETRETSREEFLRLAWTYLGIPEANCINEYGMCEMSSQFYARGASSVLQGPAWVRTLVIDPETGEPATAGKTGVLRHFDLANIDSVMAIQTEDLGEARDDGFVLKGRASQADLKGCSIDLERYLKSS